MNNSIRFLALLLFVLFSCQKEETEITNPDNEEEYILPNSQLAGLIKSVALNDGSHDNVIDSTSRLSINFPIEVQLNGQEQVVNSPGEIESQIESYTDQLDIIFPITGITADFQEITFENSAELQNFAAQPETENDIECIDFSYPMAFSAYNTITEGFETIVIENDEDLFFFITSLTEEILVSFDYPISVVSSDGNSIIINSNEELEEAIIDAIGSCDEDDDPYDQDNIPVVLENCVWIFSETANGGTVYFNPDGTVEGYNTNTLFFTGTWNLQLGNTDILTIDVPGANVAIEGTWTVTGFSASTTGYLISFDDNGQELYLLQDCNTQNECSTTITACEIETGYAEYLLSEQDECMIELTMMDPATAVVTYHLSEADAQEAIDAIVSTQPYINGSQFSEYIYVRVENENTGDYEILVILLVTENC